MTTATKNNAGSAPRSTLSTNEHCLDEENEIDLVELVAQTVADKLDDQNNMDVFLDHVIAKVRSWETTKAPEMISRPHAEAVCGDEKQDGVVEEQSCGSRWRSPLFHKYEDDEFSILRTRLLVSCFKDGQGGGGVFELDFGRNSFRSIVRCNGRGIGEYQHGFIITSRDGGVYFLDKQLNPVTKYQLENLDLHGVAIGPDGLLYIVETKHNRVGIYTIEPFERIDEIVVSEDETDRNHANDLCFHNGRLLLSMFSTENIWRENMKTLTFDGAIIEYDIESKSPIRRIAEGLKMPHTIKISDYEICYCESFDMNVIRSGTKIAQMIGYTRGLALHGNLLFVGQSRLRHRSRQPGLTLSGDAGLHILELDQRISRFVPLPTSDVYAMHVLDY